MTDFFQKIDSMLQETLSGVVPALIIAENKNIWNNLKESKNCSLGVNYIINFLELNGYKLISPINNTNEWDLLMSKNGNELKRIKVNVDFLASVGGNFSVEHFCNNKESGLLAWDCDSVVYFLPNYNKIGIITLQKLRNLVYKLKQENIGTMNMTDNNVHYYMIPLEYFDENFTIIYSE